MHIQQAPIVIHLTQVVAEADRCTTWEKRTQFYNIEAHFGIREQQMIERMRREMKRMCRE